MPTNLQITRELVLKHGWNATAFQIVNPGIEHWFTPDKDAVIGYARAAGVRVVAGAPVCNEDRLQQIILDFETDATRNRERVCYFCAAGRVHQLIGALPSHHVVVLGAQPTWNLDRWAKTIDGKASLRAQIHRAINKKVTIEEWSTTQASNHPELSKCLSDWLQTRGLPPMHFLIESQTLQRLEGRRVFVALRNNHVIAFVVCSPIPQRNGWLTEQFIRGRDAINGTIELLLDHAARKLAGEGFTFFTMGLVPLSEHNWSPDNYNPFWLRCTMKCARVFGRRFYNFRGLEAFKSKFQPHDWEPIYAISNQRKFSPRFMWAIASAFSGRSPITLVAMGALRLLPGPFGNLVSRQ